MRNLLKLGTPLSKTEQKFIHGGTGTPGEEAHNAALAEWHAAMAGKPCPVTDPCVTSQGGACVNLCLSDPLAAGR